MTDVEEARAYWSVASSFSADKEAAYPEHTIVQEFELNRGKRVLEYGCGGGSDTMSWLRRGCVVWYVDVVPENVATTRRRVREAGLDTMRTPWGVKSTTAGLLLDVSDVIPLACNFDVVSAHGVLHHVVEPMPVVRELARVLKSGGLAYVMLYTEHLWKEFDYRVAVMVSRGMDYNAAFGHCTDGPGTPYARAYAEEEGRALLEGAGLSVVKATTWLAGKFRTYKARKA